MKERILRLCKRLKNFSLEEICTIAELEKEETEALLAGFVDKKVLVINNGCYSFIQKAQKQLPIDGVRFIRHSKENVDLIIKCFCADIPIQKTADIVGVSKSCICDFNWDLRILIYEAQLKILNKKYCKKPKVSKVRNLHSVPTYFYLYKDEVFVSKTSLSGGIEKTYTRRETLDFKVVYNKIYNEISKNHTREHNVHLHAAEQLWRRNKTFQELEFDVKNLLFVK